MEPNTGEGASPPRADAAADCIFCKIAAGQIPATLEHEDEECVAFRDVAPEAPTHILIIPRRHLVNLLDCGEQEERLLGHLQLVSALLAQKLGLESYRVVVNNGAKAGQSVFHLHLHLMGGRKFHWPPG